MNVAIIAAAGQGTRMGGERPKQFQELAGIPIIIRTLNAFEQCDVIQEIIVVLSTPNAPGFLSLVEAHGLQKVSRVVPGGASRAESVLRGLQAIRPATAEIVAVHDAVRPLVTQAEITKTVKAAEQCGAAILVAPVTDTIKQVGAGEICATLDRRALRRALTPQCFRYSLLCRAYEKVDVNDPSLTDESVMVERLGVKVAAIEGSARNIKLTQPADFAVAEALLRDGEWSDN